MGSSVVAVDGCMNDSAVADTSAESAPPVAIVGATAADPARFLFAGRAGVVVADIGDCFFGVVVGSADSTAAGLEGSSTPSRLLLLPLPLSLVLLLLLPLMLLLPLPLVLLLPRVLLREIRVVEVVDTVTDPASTFTGLV